MAFRLVYPDVLGAVTGGKRVNAEGLQFAAGIFPRYAFINQPIEVVVILQNMVNAELKVEIGIALPTYDKKQRPITMVVDDTRIKQKLSAGEVGALRIPLVAVPPTPPGKKYPVRITVRSSQPSDAVSVLRPLSGGPPPSVLAVSPFQLHALRDVRFVSQKNGTRPPRQVVTFDLAPKRLPRTSIDLTPRFQTLWSANQLPDEEKLARAQVTEARVIALGLSYGTAYWDFLEVVGDRFGDRGLPLHPGEERAIAKMMAYTVDEAPTLEQADQLDDKRWFRTLCQVLAHNSEVKQLSRGEIFTQYLFDSILLDAVHYGFKVLETHVDEDLGTPEERLSYATRLLSWLAGDGDPDLIYIYLPLAMGGLVVNRLVMLNKRENPWLVVDGLREAYRGRIRLATGESVLIFEILADLLDRAAINLRNARIERD